MSASSSALAKSPDDRYPHALAMAADLKQAADEAGTALPDRIPPALSFRTSDALSEPVMVASDAPRSANSSTHP